MRTSKINPEEAIKLRNQGLTYKAIANHFGVTRQAVYDFLSNRGLNIRRCGKVYDNIPYLGLYQLFNSDRALTIPKLAAIMFNRSPSRNQVEKIRRLCVGTTTHLPIEAINKLIQYSGMTFEQLFEERKI